VRDDPATNARIGNNGFLFGGYSGLFRVDCTGEGRSVLNVRLKDKRSVVLTERF